MVRARKDSDQLTQAERTAFADFFKKNPDYDTEANGSQLADFLLNQWKVIVDAESLTIAKAKLVEAKLLVPMSAATLKLRAVISGYPEDQFNSFSGWFEKQTALVNGSSDEAFENAANLLTELRGREISIQKIDEAIGRLQYRGTTLHFNQAAKSDRPPVMRQGLPNHAATASAHKPGVMFDRNEVNQDPLDAKRHKPDTEPESEAPDAVNQRWQQKADSVRGASHAVTEQAKRILVTIPGTSQIDWEATAAARERFVGADRSVR
jgi:hypothetical protein